MEYTHSPVNTNLNKFIAFIWSLDSFTIDRIRHNASERRVYTHARTATGANSQLMRARKENRSDAHISTMNAWYVVVFQFIKISNSTEILTH